MKSRQKTEALANLLLGGLAPAGLQIAQGVPIAEALMPIGPLLATSGASVREANKREAAAKAAALDMASRRSVYGGSKDYRNGPEKNIHKG